MRNGIASLDLRARQAAWLLAGAGGVLVLVIGVWITYGVFMRYVMNDPDGTVTEATALLLLPLAFSGLAWALADDANPRVTMLVDRLPRRFAAAVNVLNGVVIVLIGVFLSALAGSATVRSYRSGAASQIIEWPEWALWFPVTVCAVVFTVLAALALLVRWRKNTPAPTCRS